MAKKAKAPPPVESGNMSVIKLRLTAIEARLVRLAAAANNLQVGAYSRAAVLEQAKKDIQAAKNDWL